MTKIKYLLIVFFILCVIQTMMAEKRIKPISMQELTDSSSPSYVPYPYPKTNKEIIDDIKYAFKKLVLFQNVWVA